MTKHEYFMNEALELAAQGLGWTSPNPLVGTVIVKDDLIVGTGWHKQADTPHAEIHALAAAGKEAYGGTLYVTLEPCCHHGRIGPCTDAIIAAGIKEVIVSIIDPNPKVAGKGVKQLEAAGIRVIAGICAEAAAKQNEVFLKWITTGQPFAVLKTAMSLDGKIAAYTGHARWITGQSSRLLVHEWRAN